MLAQNDRQRCGFDTVQHFFEVGGITVDLLSGTVQDSFGGTDTLINVESVWGSDFDDQMVGSSGDDELRGMFGSDIPGGGAGNDVLQGDVHISHPDQGGGDDTLIGGDGTDTAQFRGNLSDYDIIGNADGAIAVTDTVSGRDGTDVLSSIEILQFADGSNAASDFVSVIQVTPNAGGTALATGDAGNNIFFIDNGFTPVSFDTELITNGGFETGNNSGWIQKRH